MRIESGQDYLLFDGDCGVCSWSAEFARRMDRDREFVIEPYQKFDESELTEFGIDHQKCSRELQVITRNARVHGGAFGVNYFLWRRFPSSIWSWLVALVYAIPLLLLLEIIGYRIVARNRHRISRWFGLQACLIAPSDT